MAQEACQRARDLYEKECREAQPQQQSDRKFLMELHFHDLRAKALTDKRTLEGAEAAQALAGHMTGKMTAHYTKAGEVERVKPVTMKRAS